MPLIIGVEHTISIFDIGNRFGCSMMKNKTLFVLLAVIVFVATGLKHHGRLRYIERKDQKKMLAASQMTNIRRLTSNGGHSSSSSSSGGSNKSDSDDESRNDSSNDGYARFDWNLLSYCCVRKASYKLLFSW
jgi:hypothetical protein